MPFVDRTNQKRMFMVGALLQIVALRLFALFPLGLAVAIGYVVLLGIGGGFSCKSGFHTLAWILTGFLVASALLGLFFAPSNAGKTLDELHPEDQPATGRFSRAPLREPAETS
jgi:inositol transporter-like SP family MFS transporter